MNGQATRIAQRRTPLLDDARREPARGAPDGLPTRRELLIGRLLEVERSASAVVEFTTADGPRHVAALSTVPLRPTDIGRRAVLAFVAGELDRPIVLGLLAEADGLQDATESAAEVSDEPDELVLTANRQIVLRCGKATLTLTRAGKILLRGTYLLARSSGVNRIKGASVQIN